MRALSRRQAGYTTIGMIMAVAIAGVLSANLMARLQRQAEDREESARVEDIQQLAQAQIALFTSTGSFETDLSVDPATDLVRSTALADFLPIFRNPAGRYAVVLPAGPAGRFRIITDVERASTAESLGAARRIAARLGGIADVRPDPGTVGDPVELSRVRATYQVQSLQLWLESELDDVYLRLDGRVAMDVGSTLTARTVTADTLVESRNTADDARMEADIGVVDTLSSTVFDAVELSYQ